MKRAANRPKDRVAVEEYIGLADLQRANKEAEG